MHTNMLEPLARTGKVPDALRRAGLIQHLAANGCSIVDFGDLPKERFQPDRESQ